MWACELLSGASAGADLGLAGCIFDVPAIYDDSCVVKASLVKAPLRAVGCHEAVCASTRHGCSFLDVVESLSPRPIS